MPSSPLQFSNVTHSRHTYLREVKAFFEVKEVATKGDNLPLQLYLISKPVTRENYKKT